MGVSLPLQTSLDAISKSSHMPTGIQENFKSLISKLNTMFPNVSLEHFNSIIPTFRVQSGGKFLVSGSMRYSIHENVLYLNKEEVQKADCEHDLMSVVLMMTTAHGNTYGIDDDTHKLEAINVGTTEMISNLLVGNDVENCKNMDELVLTNLVGTVIDVDNLVNAYFSGNSEIIYRRLSAGQNPKNVFDLLESANYNLHSRNVLGRSNLSSIQMEFSKLYVTSDNYKMFQDYFVTNEALLSEHIVYLDLGKVQDMHQGMLETSKSKKVA